MVFCLYPTAYAVIRRLPVLWSLPPARPSTGQTANNSPGLDYLRLITQPRFELLPRTLKWLLYAIDRDSRRQRIAGCRLGDRAL